MKGKIAFKVYDTDNTPKGYIGKEVKKDGWFYPKGFKRDFVYNLKWIDTAYSIVVFKPVYVVQLTALGFPICVALMARSAIEEQVHFLKRFRRILLIHQDGENIALRLSQQSFVKIVKKIVSKR